MLEFLNNFLGSSSFSQEHCYLWAPRLISLHILPGVLITLAYFLSASVLVYFISRQCNIAFPWVLTSNALVLPMPPIVVSASHQLQLEIRDRKRKRAEAALQATHARLAAILNIAEDATISVDENMCIQMFNQQAEKIFGYMASEVLGQPLNLIVVKRLMAHACVVESDDRSQLLGRRKDGTEFPVEASIAKLELEEEKVTTIILRDISDSVAAAAAQQASEQRFRTIFEAAGIGIAIIDQTGRFTQINPALEAILGYSDEHLRSMLFTEVTHPDDIETYWNIYEDLLAGKRPYYQMEKRYINSWGQCIWGRLTVSLVQGQGDEAQFTIAMIEDITERKQAEAALRESEEQLRQRTQQLEQILRELQQAQAQLVQSEKMSSLGLLVAGVAHEINNPVNFIYGNLVYANEYIESLQDLLHLYTKHYPDPPDEITATAKDIDLDFILADLPKLLSSMKLGAERICEIVLSLRNFSRIEQAEMKPVNIHEGIDSTLLLLQNRFKEKAGHPSIQIIKEYGNLPLVECCVGQLNQVFMNLLSNAIDALEEPIALNHFSKLKGKGQRTREKGQIKIRTEVMGGNQVVIRITDNGPGITEEVLSRLFDPFFTTKPVGKGTGLGLSISYQIVVDKHGGILKCISEPDQGAEFIIQIPIQQHSQQAA